MITTPEQQKAAAEAARKEGEVKQEPKKPAPASQPMAGSPQKLQMPTTTTTASLKPNP